VESGEKDTVIVEIPKGNFTPLPLSDILESEEYKQTECNIPVVIGCRPNGEVIIEDLALCKHILIGGGVSNSALASYMEANGLTNADLNTLLTDNFRRYYLLLN
jgi:hypothetical protein